MQEKYIGFIGWSKKNNHVDIVDIIDIIDDNQRFQRYQREFLYLDQKEKNIGFIG